MSTSDTTRVEIQMRSDDYAILARLATARNMSVAALIRHTLYEGLQPLGAAQREREQISTIEARERQKMREWTGGSGGDNR